MKKILILLIISLATAPVFAGYSYLTGNVTEIEINGDNYTTASDIRFKTDNMASGVDWYIITADEVFRKEMLSMLLTAKTTGNKLKVKWHATVNDTEEKVSQLVWQ